MYIHADVTHDRARYQVGQDLRSHDISLISTLPIGSGGRRRKIVRLREPGESRADVAFCRAIVEIQMPTDRFRSAIGIARRYFATLRRSRSAAVATEVLSPWVWP